jgi:hypothetical protein
MVESRNISGSTEVVIFPNLNDSIDTFNNRNISNKRERFINPYLKQLVIANTHTADITVSLSIFNKRELSFSRGEVGISDDNPELEYKYYILKDVVLPSGTSVLLDEDELCLFDPFQYGLKAKLAGSSESMSIIYKIVGYVNNKGKRI